MRRPTIREINNTIATIRQAYPFSDDAEISMVDLRSMDIGSVLTLFEIDKDTGSEVTISRKIEYDNIDTGLLQNKQ